MCRLEWFCVSVVLKNRFTDISRPSRVELQLLLIILRELYQNRQQELWL